jgi:hypothetical protein
MSRSPRRRDERAAFHVRRPLAVPILM